MLSTIPYNQFTKHTLAQQIVSINLALALELLFGKYAFDLELAYSHQTLIYCGYYGMKKARDLGSVKRAYYSLGDQINYKKMLADLVFRQKWAVIHSNCLLQAPKDVRNPVCHQTVNYMSRFYLNQHNYNGYKFDMQHLLKKAVLRKELFKASFFINSYGHILAIPDFWEEGSRSKEDYVNDMECIIKIACIIKIYSITYKN